MRFHTIKHRSILSASLVLAATFGMSAILGFIRSRFLYAHFFNCCVSELDAYNAAFRIPDLIFKLLVTGALSASFIPVYSSILHKNEKQAEAVASTVINLLLIAFGIISVIVLIFTPYFTSLIASGFTPDQLALMTSLTRILLIAQIFFLVSNFLTGILQVHQIFLVPALSPIIYNSFIILSILVLAPIFGIYGVTYGAVIGAFFHMAIQIPSVIHAGFNYRAIIDTKLAGVREIIRLMLPRSLSLGLGEIENTVTLFFASNLAAGSLSILNLAMQIMYLPSRIFATTVGQASLPILSKNVARNELNEFRETVRRTILQSLYVALPITALILVHRLAIIRLAFGAKEFPWAATLLTSKTLAYLVPAIACQAIIQILVRSFYALHDTKTPLKISLVSLTVNVISAYIFVNFTDMGVVGLALSASLGNLTQTIGLVGMFINKIDGQGWDKVFIHFFKIILASAILSVSVWSSLKFLDLFILDTTKTINLTILFVLSSTIGFVVYFIVSSWLKIDEVNSYKRLLLRLVSWVRPS